MIDADILELSNKARRLRIEVCAKLSRITDDEEKEHADQAQRMLFAVEALLVVASGVAA